jgi:hypothetical protein
MRQAYSGLLSASDLRLLVEQLARDVPKPPGASVPAISRISRTARIPGIAGVADVPGVAEPLIEDHLILQLAHVRTTDLVYMSAAQLTYSVPVHRVDISPSDKAHGPTALLVDEVSHVPKR